MITLLICWVQAKGYVLERPFKKRPFPKTTVSRPIIEFGGLEGYFLLVDSRPFWEAAFLGKKHKKRSFYFKHDRRTRVTIVTLGTVTSCG